MSDHNPLNPVERAHEEEYFRRHNAELIAKMKAKMAAEALGEATGVHDEELLEHLVELGLSKETVGVLHLAPLVEVAWADGEIAYREKKLVLEAAEATGVVAGTPAYTALTGMLEKRPDEDFFDSALSYLKVVLAAMPDAEARAATAKVEDLCYAIADCTGGVWGLWGTVEDSERAALRHIAQKLADVRPGASAALLQKL